jgi:hypothetical protein
LAVFGEIPSFSAISSTVKPSITFISESLTKKIKKSNQIFTLSIDNSVIVWLHLIIGWLPVA